VATELVERGALGREDAPVRLARRMGALEHVERLPVVPGIGERAPVCAEQAAVLRVLRGGPFQHRNRLRAQTICAQRPRIV
jgi:hypothetical protein